MVLDQGSRERLTEAEPGHFSARLEACSPFWNCASTGVFVLYSPDNDLASACWWRIGSCFLKARLASSLKLKLKRSPIGEIGFAVSTKCYLVFRRVRETRHKWDHLALPRLMTLAVTGQSLWASVNSQASRVSTRQRHQHASSVGPRHSMQISPSSLHPAAVTLPLTCSSETLIGSIRQTWEAFCTLYRKALSQPSSHQSRRNASRRHPRSAVVSHSSIGNLRGSDGSTVSSASLRKGEFRFGGGEMVG